MAPLASRKERLIRSVLLLVCCALFSVIAWAAGAYRLSDQNWTYICILVIVAVSALISRFGAKWIMRRYPASQAGPERPLP